MKKLILLLSLLVLSAGLFAQTLKIVITYDAMGHRIKRELICDGCPPPSSPSDNDEPSPQKPIDILAAGMAFDVYPNPFIEQLNVKIDATTLAQKPTLQLLDITGRIIQEIVISNLETKFNIQHLPAGTYVVAMDVKGTIYKKNVVKVE